MEMEHINENLIKVMIGPEDLEERGIDFLDLIGDQSSIEKFFYSILEEVDVDKHFQGSEAVTFQVMPNQDGLELYISRANFDEMEDIWEDELTKQLMARKKKLKQQVQDKKVAENDTNDYPEELSKQPIIQFENLDHFIALAREVPTDLVQARLYGMNQHYYLVIDRVDESIRAEAAYHKYLAMLEYGEKQKISQYFLEEHGKLIHSGDTLKFFGQQF